jgi:hypothetical protein
MNLDPTDLSYCGLSHLTISNGQWATKVSAQVKEVVTPEMRPQSNIKGPATMKYRFSHAKEEPLTGITLHLKPTEWETAHWLATRLGWKPTVSSVLDTSNEGQRISAIDAGCFAAALTRAIDGDWPKAYTLLMKRKLEERRNEFGYQIALQPWLRGHLSNEYGEKTRQLIRTIRDHFAAGEPIKIR